MSGLAKAYIDGDAFVRGLFEQPPEPRVNGAPTEWNRWIAEACRDYSGELGVTRELPKGPAVITGQQTGLLGGPLYTVLKAITTIELAERLSRESGQPCTPVFWLAGDDHDFEEVSSVTLLTKTNEPLTLSWQPQADITNRAMHRVPLDDGLDALIEQVAQVTRGSEWRESVLDFLKESRGRYDNLCDWTGAILARLFQDTPLVFFAPHLEPARYHAIPVLAREIEEPLASTRLLIEAGEALAAQGYEIPLQKQPDQCQFFYSFDGVRYPVRFRDGHFHIANGESYTPSQLRRKLDDEVGNFSAGAALRPIVQQALFPTAAYVAGPGEIAYWAQLKPLFQFHALPMPAVVPRMQAVVMSQKDRQVLDDLGWPYAHLHEPLQDLVEEALRGQASNPAVRELRRQQSQVTSALDEAVAAMEGADARSREMMRRVAEKTAHGLERIERSMLHADKASLEAMRTRVARLQNRLAPHRKPQERVYGAASWLFEHGWELVPRLAAQLDLDARGVQEIVL